jgi:hypothetical protein
MLRCSPLSIEYMACCSVAWQGAVTAL